MLSDYQYLVLGAVASVIVWAIKRYTERSGKPVKPVIVTVGLFIVSLGLALFWVKQAIPAPPPFGGDAGSFATAMVVWLNDLVAVLGGYVAFAVLIYQAFVKYLLEKGIPLGVRNTQRWLKSKQN